MIPLIDKQDFFEIVLAQVGAILAAETIAQQALAVTAGEDPALWAFDTYIDRYNPYEEFQNDVDATPIVNIWYDNSNFPRGKGQSVGRVVSSTSYNIDIYAAAASEDDPTGGYLRGDEESAKNLHRIIRLVRNIIMHPDNQYLQLTQAVGGRTQNLIFSRWIDSIQVFQPQIDDRPATGVIAARCSLSVEFNELPVTETYNPLETVYATAKRAEDGKIIFEAQFETT